MKDKRHQGSKRMARRVAFGQRDEQRKGRTVREEKLKTAIETGDFREVARLSLAKKAIKEES